MKYFRSVFFSARDADLRAEIQRQEARLRKELSAREISRKMFQKGALEPEELECILSKKTEAKAADRLLSIVLERKECQVRNCFLEALKQVGQYNLYESLVLPGLQPSMNIEETLANVNVFIAYV